MRWVVLLARVAAEPSRHRVAVWRELRRLGAVAIGQSVWALPDHPAATSGLGRIAELVDRGDGELTVLEATGRDQASRERLERLYVEARAAEWTEFRAECARYLAEIDKEVGKGKLIVAELEEEEQSLERLRRWHHELRARDMLATPAAHPADQDLKACAAKLEDYTTQVFQALNEG
jgi:vacuolar-type H+-ATPase subunit I/STV1